MIALNSSAAMARKANTKVLLADFDLNSGMMRFMLKLDNKNSVLDAVERADEMDDRLAPENGTLRKYHVELIGADIDAIEACENRERFKEIVTGLGAEVPASQICRDLEECLATAASLKYPVVIRPSFTLGGSGGDQEGR